MHILIKLFLRSLSIQASRNSWRMQNLGFAYAMIPIIRQQGKTQNQIALMLTRYLQPFNTHPYMSGPIIGTVAKLEEGGSHEKCCGEPDKLKKALMAPYAAIGDALFWGALKPFAAVCSVVVALQGCFIAALLFLLLFNSFHIWIRLTGLAAGYRMGKGGIDYIRKMNLPQLSRRIRWLSVIILGILAYYITAAPLSVAMPCLGMMSKPFVLILISLCFLFIAKGISVLKILYGTSLLFILVIMLW